MRVEPSVSTRWLFYAMGGGLGHLTRTVSLARAVAAESRRRRAPLELHIVTNTRLDPQACQAELPDAAFHFIKPSDTQATRDAVRRCITDINPAVFVVDCFPRGLGGELPDLLAGSRALRVLTHRDLNRRYVDRYELKEFVAAHYDLLLSPGEEGPLADCVPTERTSSWLIRDDHELAARDAARSRFDAVAGRPLIAVVASGKPEELLMFESVQEALTGELSCAAEVRLIAPPGASPPAADRLAIWPLLPWIRGVDLLIGGGGYNTVNEMRAVGVPFVALAQPRLYDDQAKRLCKPGAGRQPAHDVVSSARRLVPAAMRAAQRCVNSFTDADSSPRYCNGARDAARVLLTQAMEPTVELEETLR